MVEQTTWRELADFVGQRIEDEIDYADEAGDKAALAWALASRDLLARMRRDLDERPWARPEVGSYLLRAARIRREHPEYRDWWG